MLWVDSKNDKAYGFPKEWNLWLRWVNLSVTTSHASVWIKQGATNVRECVPAHVDTSQRVKEKQGNSLAWKPTQTTVYSFIISKWAATSLIDRVVVAVVAGCYPLDHFIVRAVSSDESIVPSSWWRRGWKGIKRAGGTIHLGWLALACKVSKGGRDGWPSNNEFTGLWEQMLELTL